MEVTILLSVSIVCSLIIGWAFANLYINKKSKDVLDQAEAIKAGAEAQIVTAKRVLDKAEKLKPKTVLIKPFDETSIEHCEAINQILQNEPFMALLISLRERAIKAVMGNDSDVGNRALGRIEACEAILDAIAHHARAVEDAE